MDNHIDNKIRPYRNIPFDIGCTLDHKDVSAIKEAFKTREIVELPVPQLLKSFSKYILLSFEINADIRLYIYAFGIGVFTLRDDDYDINMERYAVNYCDARKNCHHNILKGEHKYSHALLSIAECLRKCVSSNHKELRITASSSWEHNGFSYVMTVSAIQLQGISSFDYSKLPDIEQKNLQIMLEPGIAHKEDSMLMDKDIISGDFDPYDTEIMFTDIPVNWIRSNDMGLYISWAAVLIYSGLVDDNSARYIECMEVDLQAMWMYVYCMYYVLSNAHEKSIKVSDLKKTLFSFKRMYNEFSDTDDSSVAEYFRNIRDELIRTSGIVAEKDKLIEYLNYCIEDTVCKNEEKARKYSVFSEILLFIIAYVQIAPLVYHLLMGDYVLIGTWQIILTVTIAVIGIVLIILKE